MFNWIYKLFNPVPEDEQPITTESIHERIESKREDDAARDLRIGKEQARIEEILEIFPIGFPASSTEITLALDEWLGYSVHAVLEKLVRDERSGWEYVNVDGCTLFQRVELLEGEHEAI